MGKHSVQPRGTLNKKKVAELKIDGEKLSMVKKE